jgi:hypothetical protein
MLGFKSFENAGVVIAVIELAQKISKNHTTCDGWVAPMRATLRCGSG